MYQRGRARGFALLFVLFLGVFLVALAGSLLVLSNSQAQRSIGGRERTAAEVSADNGLNYLMGTQRDQLLTLGQDGQLGPADAEDPYLLVQDAKFYFASLRLDDTLDDYLDQRALATDFKQAKLHDQQNNQQWWLYSLGAVQWRPLDLPELRQRQGIARIGEREVVVVGEALNPLGNVTQRQLRGRNLGFYLDFNDPLVTLRPEAVIALVPVLGFDPGPYKQPIFSLRGSLSAPSPLHLSGPLLIDAPDSDAAALAVRGQSTVSFEPGAKITDANRTLYPEITKSDQGLWVIGPGKVDREPLSTVDTAAQSINVSRRATLQLDLELAKALGQQGTTFEGEFKGDQDISNEKGEVLFDSKTGNFDLTKARNGILYVSGKPLILRSDGYRTFTYSGQGTIVVTANGGFFLQNSSLLPRDPDSSLSIVVAPEPEVLATPLPPGAVLAVPPSVQLTFGNPIIPQTVLADEKDQVITFDCSLNSRLASPDPLVANNPKVKRLNNFLSVGRISVPSGARAFAIDDQTCVILARQEKTETQVILSLGLNTAQQAGKLLPRSLLNARVTPLQRLEANIYSMNPMQVRSSNRIVGRVVAPRLRVLPGIPSSLYGPDQKDRYQVDFLYKLLPPTPGDWLMTLRADLTPRPMPLPITYLEPRTWRTLPASVLTADGGILTAPPAPKVPGTPALALATVKDETSPEPDPNRASDQVFANLPSSRQELPPTPPTLPASVPVTAAGPRLRSIAQGSQGRFAQISFGDQTFEIKVGATVQGWQVIAITDSTTVLSRSQKKLVLSLQ